MSRAEMAECIPPCYGAFIGQQAVNWILHNTGSHRPSEPEASEGSVS